MATIPDINIEYDVVQIDVAPDVVNIDASTQNPVVDVTMPVVDVGIALSTTPAIDIAEVPDVNFDVSVTNPVIEITLIGGSSYTEKNFRDVVISLDVPSGQGEYVLDGGRQFFILGYTATVAGIWIRGYADTTYRDFDSARPITEDPLLNGGVLFELVTEIGDYKFSIPATAYSVTTMPLLVESTTNSPIDTSITFAIY